MEDAIAWLSQPVLPSVRQPRNRLLLEQWGVPPPGLLIYVLMTAGAALGSTGALRRSSAFLHQALLLDLYIQTNQELRPARQSLLVYFQTAGLLHRTDTIRIQEIA